MWLLNRKAVKDTSSPFAKFWTSLETVLRN